MNITLCYSYYLFLFCFSIVEIDMNSFIFAELPLVFDTSVLDSDLNGKVYRYADSLLITHDTSVVVWGA